MIGLDGRGELCAEHCARCKIEPAVYECTDCSGRELMCSVCIVAAHSRLYLHHIQVSYYFTQIRLQSLISTKFLLLQKWNGQWFEKTCLKDLGLRLQLGHVDGERCLNPERVRNDDFVIIDTNSIHNVSLDFCGCGNITQNHVQQLLRARLFPATITNPKTAATFKSLEYLEILSYEAKLSVFEFFQTTSRCTDNTGMDPPKVCHALLQSHASFNS